MSNTSSAADVKAAEDIVNELLHTDIGELLGCTPTQTRALFESITDSNVIPFPGCATHYQNLAAALQYAEAGIAVFPCRDVDQQLPNPRDPQGETAAHKSRL